MKIIKTGLLVILALTGSTTLAQTTSVPPESVKPAPARVSGTEELDTLRAQNAILAEQVKAYELRNKMGVVVPPIDGSALPIPLSRSMGGTVQSNRMAGSGSTQVTMVAGQRDQGLVATIQTPDGSTVAVRVGDTVPGVGKVKSIEVHQVLIESGKKSAVSLPFAPEPTNSAIQGAASMPSLPIPGQLSR